MRPHTSDTELIALKRDAAIKALEEMVAELRQQKADEEKSTQTFTDHHKEMLGKRLAEMEGELATLKAHPIA